MVAKMYCRKWDSKKSFLITRQELESWKLIKQIIIIIIIINKKIKNKYDPSFLLKLEDLKEQVKFYENEKLLLKE